VQLSSLQLDYFSSPTPLFNFVRLLKYWS